LAELLHGRIDIFVQSGEANSLDGEDTIVANSCDCTESFAAQLISLSIRFNESEDVLPRRYVEIHSSLHLGLVELCESRKIVAPLPTSVTRDRQGNVVIPLIDQIKFDISTRDIPRAARIMFRLSVKKKRNDKLVFTGWCAVPLYNFKGCLESFVDLKIFEGENVVPINTTLSNNSKLSPGGISVIIGPGADSAEKIIVHCSPPRSNPIVVDSEELNPIDVERLKTILYISFDPLSMQKLTAEDLEFVWNVRYNIINRAELLPAFVMCIRWNDAERVQELYDLLDIWSSPTPLEALQLLDRRFMDPKVRAYAAHCIEELTDEELALYMLQLVQQLKFEAHVDSALSRLLLRRSLKNKRLIGHLFFWLLQSEVYNIDVRARFTALLEIYLKNCGHHRIELGQQMYVMKRLEAIALKVVEGESKAERLEIMRQQLKDAVLPNEFQLPLDPHMRASGFVIEGCRVMESKKKPLWLSLKNCADESKNIVLMLKVGDDLRQDALILQLLRIMNDLWKKEGLDLQMMIYGCISTGDERGLLEVVLNSSTLGGILLDATDANKAGSKSGSISRKLTSAMKALNDYDVLKEWIWKNVCKDIENEEARPEEMEKRTQNFIVSTAAYCVASYVLGLGDRHNDNLMITKQAKFFHIDFGHILGNFKSKYGIKRERAPMVFTHAMKNVMRPDQYGTFVELCCDIYNILRRHSSLLVSLFSLAIPCNLPELQEEEDVSWIYEKLLVGKTDEEAAIHFREELERSLNTRGTRINDAVHMIAHA
jgi:Phosphatidylinositol 3- and 4-kinase/Phosphoinositide 3-kinase family, accessory domain (PIK domain)